MLLPVYVNVSSSACVLIHPPTHPPTHLPLQVDWQEGRTGQIYTDQDFPADLYCITGRETDKGRKGSGKEGGGGAPPCRCDKEKYMPAKLCTVSKEGPNQGKKFWGCAKGPGDQVGGRLIGSSLYPSVHYFSIHPPTHPINTYREGVGSFNG